MKLITVALITLLSVANAATQNPVQKALSLLSDLAAKVTKDGEQAETQCRNKADWCSSTQKETAYQIETAKSNIDSLKADIQAASAAISAADEEIGTKSGSIASNEGDLKAASDVRASEAAEFSAGEAELAETIDVLSRAITILQREQAKHGAAAMLQFQRNSAGIVQALNALVDASMLNSHDVAKLTALVQNGATEDDNSDELGAPAAAVYEGHAGDIVETLQGLQEKAKDQLDAARKKETTSRHNFEMLKQSLQDEIKFAQADFEAAQKSKAANGEAKAVAEGELSATSAKLASDTTLLSDTEQDCRMGADNCEAAKASRAEELKAINDAKRVISEKTGGAAGAAYGLNQVSFLQVRRSSLASGTDLANFEAVRLVRDLARKENSDVLAQLAMRMSSAMRFASTSGADPFAKVRGLITDMLARLEKESKKDADHNSYCTKENAATKAKKEEKSAVEERLQSKVDSLSARSQQLKAEVSATQKDLADMASSQAEADSNRNEEAASFKQYDSDTTLGLEGIREALKILREYYNSAGGGHEKSAAAGGIVSMLEVVESDFAKGLSLAKEAEAQAAQQHERQTQDFKVQKASMEQDVVYKTKESKSLDKKLSEVSADHRDVQSELKAIDEYAGKLSDMCTDKAMPYAERKARREAELAGLKEALEILENQSFLQRKHSLRLVRGRRL